MENQWIVPIENCSEIWKHVLVLSNCSVIKCKYYSSIFQPAATSSIIYHLEKVENVKIKKFVDLKETEVS